MRFLDFICRTNMNRKILSSKICFIFILTFGACKTTKRKVTQNIANKQVNVNIFASGIHSILSDGRNIWNVDADYLSQQLFSLEYSTVIEGQKQRLTFLPRDTNWTLWDVQKPNALPIVVANNRSNDLQYKNKGFPILTGAQRKQLDDEGYFHFLDPTSFDTLKMYLSKKDPIQSFLLDLDGTSKECNVLTFNQNNNDSIELLVLASHKNPLILKYSGKHTYEVIAASANVLGPLEPVVIQDNMVFNYFATSPEGTMTIRVKIGSITRDTVSCVMEGSVDDAYLYDFKNTVIYCDHAFTNPKFVSFLPSLILDSLFYEKEGMCFLSSETLHSWYENNKGSIGVGYFISENESTDAEFEKIEVESFGIMQAYKEGKKKYSTVSMQMNNGVNRSTEEWPVCKFANYNTNCFLEVIPTNKLGLVYRVSSSDMLWDIQLRSITYLSK